MAHYTQMITNHAIAEHIKITTRLCWWIKNTVIRCYAKRISTLRNPISEIHADLNITSKEANVRLSSDHLKQAESPLGYLVVGMYNIKVYVVRDGILYFFQAPTSLRFADSSETECERCRKIAVEVIDKEHQKYHGTRYYVE